jgi:alpha-D-ribose 1-methylphosphonate 5-triphosphate synthase subunit PhnL
VGTAILVETAEGDIPAPDGTHEVEGGTLVTTVGGVVSEIVEPSPEVEVEIEASQEFATIEKFNEVVSNLENRIAALTAKFGSVVATREKKSEAFSKTVDLVEKVANLPSAEPTKAPETLSKKEQQFANIVKIAQQLKK